MKVGLIGCGNIVETYFRSQTYFNNIHIVSCADVKHEIAEQCAQQYKIQSQSVEEILTDDSIDIILNLTPYLLRLKYFNPR